MRLKYAFEKMKMGDSYVAVPVGEEAESSRIVVKLNETADYLFELLKEDRSEEDIIKLIEKEYDASRDVIKEDVRKYIEYFQQKGLLI